MERIQTRELKAVTSIYRGRIDDVVLHDPYGDNLSFSLVPTARLWGETPPGTLGLEFEAGACTNWMFLGEDEALPSPAGLRVIVLAGPESLTDHRWLYILRADAGYVEHFLNRWREASGHDLKEAPQ